MLFIIGNSEIKNRKWCEHGQGSDHGRPQLYFVENGKSLISLIIGELEHFFTYPLAISLYAFFEQISIQVFNSCLNQVITFFAIEL